MRQKVVNVVPEGGSLFEIATPTGVWSPQRAAAAGVDVEFVSCAINGGEVRLQDGVMMSGLDRLEDHLGDADIVVVPTWPISQRPVPTALAEGLASAHEDGARVVGLCLGAFAVGAAGLLDGESGVTHWYYRSQFEAAFPSVTFEPDTLYVDLGSRVTSAGSAAALDCCLHIIRTDHGAEAAATIARSLVTAPHRGGTQSQFSAAPPLKTEPNYLGRVLAAAAQDIASVADVTDLAELAQCGRRSLERQMRERLGVTPKEWIDEQRVIHASRLLETTDQSITEIAAAAGYGSTPTLRRAFRARRRTTPTAYRAEFSSA